MGKWKLFKSSELTGYYAKLHSWNNRIIISKKSSSCQLVIAIMPQPILRALYLYVLNFIRFAGTHFSRLSRSLQMAYFPFSMLTTEWSHSLVLSANVLKMHLIPWCICTLIHSNAVFWCYKIWKWTYLGTDSIISAIQKRTDVLQMGTDAIHSSIISDITVYKRSDECSSQLSVSNYQVFESSNL